MIKEKPNIWVFESPQTVSIWWDHIPFELTASFQWRNITFHVRVSAHKIENGSTRTLSFLFNSRAYHCKLTKWKYMGGGHGDKCPDIATRAHEITIFSGLDFLSLTDKSIMPGMEDVKSGEPPFSIIYPVEDIDFDFPLLN